MRHMLAAHLGRSVSGAFVADCIFCHHAHVAIQLLSFPSLGNSYSMYEVAPRLRGAVKDTITRKASGKASKVSLSQKLGVEYVFFVCLFGVFLCILPMGHKCCDSGF